MNLKKKTMTALFLVLVTMGTSAFVYSQDWPMFGHDPQNTGYSSSDGPSTGDLQWVYEIKGFVLSSPTVVDGKVYIGAMDGKVYCLDAYTGAWIWEYNTQTGIDSTPTVDENKVYIGGGDGKIYCLNADTGAWIWDTQTGPSPSSPVIADVASLPRVYPAVADKVVIVCSENGNVYFLDVSNGDIEYVKEQIPPDVSPIYASPTVADGIVYYAWYDSQIRAMELGGWGPRGGFLASFVVSAPAVADGKLYACSEDHKVYCFDVGTQGEIWDFPTGDEITSSPAVADGEVYICSEDGKVYCLDAYTGAWIWEYTAGIGMTSSPAVAENKVYIGGGDGKIYCLNADTGAWIWDYFIKDDITASPAVADGKVYITSYTGRVYCIGSTLDERVASLEAENAALRSDLDALNARMSETEIIFTELPGERLNIYLQGEYTVSADETTHVWHGYVSNPWSEYTEEQKTEFLSTAQWRFTVDGTEVPLDHVFRYKDGYMWSIYYRVFPPGYFKIGSHRLVGEWHSMEDGVWDSKVLEAKLRVK